MSLAGKFTDVLSAGQGVHPHGHAHVDSVSTHAPFDAIIIPDAHLLFTGDFTRAGTDLILTGGERELVLHDYFKGEKRAALASPDGAHLTGDIINALTGHTQFAQADGSASVATVIGHVTKLTGTATAIRNGVSIILNQGDNVNKGDVVQSGSDSTLGITFIDGTVFGLASNAKMVLNEMIYDPNGSGNKSLLSLIQGTISFVAGATAKNGDMKVDTPVATMGIRGTAVLVEIDFEVPAQGGAPPAKFQVLVEPDGTTGSYILFDKTTLTPIATVNQAGTQTIINGQGTVSFSSSTQLSPDAQKVISDVFSLKFSDLNNPNTKLTTNFTDSIVPESLLVKLAGGDFVSVRVQIIDVPEKPAASPGSGPGTKLEHIPGAPDAAAAGGAVAELTDTTASAKADSVSGIVNYADINAGDVPSVKTAFSSFIYQNAQGANVTATLTAQQLAAVKAVEVPLSVAQDPNGKNTGAATWTYKIADGAFDFLAAGETLKLTYTAQVDNNYAPNNETTFVPFTIVITGTNDKPTIATTGSAITERIGTGNAAVDVATGTVTFTDVDLTDHPVVSASFSDFKYSDAEGTDVTALLTPEQLAAILAVEVPLTVVQTAGNTNNGTATWTYSISDSAFDFLAKGETLTLNYVAQVDDGHGGVVSTPISVSINGADIDVVGTNDVPTIATTSNAFAERSNDTQPNPTGSTAFDTVSGTISFTDVDLTDRPVASAAFTSFTYQKAFIHPNAFDADGTSLLTTAQLAAVEAPLSAAQLAAIAAVEVPLSVVQAAGNTNNGSATWTYSVADKAFDFLADGEILTLTYTATVDDVHGGVVTKPITVTVTGSNDTPLITSGPQTGTIAELAGTHDSTTPDTAGGTIAFTDVDLTDTHEVTITGVAASGVTTGLANGVIQLSWLSLGALTDSTDGVTGSKNWSFSAADDYFDYLADGEAVTLTYTVEVDDHHGGHTSQDVVVTVNGSNDAPEIAAIAQQDLAEQTNTAPLTAAIPVTFTDIDLSDVGHTAAVTHAVASGTTTGLALDEAALIALVKAGTVTKAAGSSAGAVDLNFSAVSTAFDYLATGQKLTLTYTVAIDDHDGGVTPKTFVVTITGTDDAPVLSAIAQQNLIEQTDTAPLTTTIPVTFTDVDLTDVGHTAAVTHAVASGTTTGLTLDEAALIALVKAGTVTKAAGSSAGSVDLNFFAASTAFDYLSAGEKLTLTYTVAIDDHDGGVTPQTFVVTVTGTDDAPVVAAIAQQDLTEQTDTAPLNTTIPVTFSDVDLTDVGHTAAVTHAVASGTTTGLALDEAALIALVKAGTVTKAAGASTGAVDLNFSAASSAFDYLATGQKLTLTYTVAIDDHDGGVTPKTFVIAVNGSNDAPSIVGEVDPPAQTVIVAAPTSPIVLAAGVNTNALGLNTETFDGLSTGSSSNNGAGHGNFQSAALGATFLASGNAGIVNGSSRATAAPFVGPSPGHKDTTNYLSIGGNGTETITFASEKNAFGLYWGSLDSYNTIKFYEGATLVASYTGADISPLFPNGNQGSFVSNGYVEFSGLQSFNKVVLGSASNAFEIDNISAGNVPAPKTGLSGPIKGTLSAYDADIGDTLTAFVTGNATIEYNGLLSVPGGIDISALIDAADVTFDSAPSNGGTVVLNWTYAPTNPNFDFLHAGDVLKIKFIAEVSDGHGHTGSQPLTVTLIGADSAANASIASAAGPVIGTDAFSVTENENGTTTVSGLYVSDSDATASTETFTVGTEAGSPNGSVTPSAGVGSLAAVNATLDSGITYDPSANPPQTDMVTLAVSDGFGHTDTVHFVFKQAAEGPVALNGTSGKDVIFASGSDDTLTGGASADQFVFAPEQSPSTDTITDFKPGEDHIDVRLFSEVVDSDNINGWLAANAVQSSTNPADVLIALGNDTLTLKNVNVANLHASDFIVSPHHVVI